jgi:carbamoyltransferase
MKDNKYISFDGWWGGFSNIRMTYELAAAISVITNRTLILPPKIYCLFLAEHHQKDTFFNWWDAFDLDAFKSQFNCVSYEDIPEYVSLENNIQYYENIDKIANIILFKGDEYKQWGVQRGISNNQVLICNIDDQEDFGNFSQGRDIINLDLPDKFIHFPRNLFGHFYYHVYGNGPIQRNLIRDKIQNGLKYRPEFFKKTKLVKEKIGKYNAIHVRRNDFLQTRPDTSTSQLNTLLDDIKDRIPNNIPLYIATDEQNKELFDILKTHYNTIYFQNDFYLNLNKHESLILDQIVCSEADIFLGSKYSTFSDYINVLRGYNNKKDFHREGTNFKLPDLKYNRFPWKIEDYSWDKIYDSYWKHERSFFNLGIYGSHNSSVTISYKGDILEVVDLERWIGVKNAAFYHHFPIKNPIEVTKEIYEYFKKKYNAFYYDNVIHNSCIDNHLVFPAAYYEWTQHHIAHVNNVIYQSKAEKSLNISFDGGSDEGYFNIYLGEKGKVPEKIFNSPKDLAICYQTTAHYLSHIKQEDNWWWGNLVYAGKIMGLAAYGEIDDNLIDKYREFYDGQLTDDVNIAHERFQKIFNITPQNRIEGKLAENMAKTNQAVFEETFNKIVTPFIEKYKDRELQFSGGGAMNIINNTIYDAFVSPNPDDRGISLGLVASKILPKYIDSTYLGSEPYDKLPPYEDYSIDQVADDLIRGEIIGLIQGRSEHGARALGNRSIICLPKKGMKDKLNVEIKKRENFRPFAPIARLEDADKYFIFGKHTRWMTHNAVVKEEFKNDLDSIVHIDGTARLQTVTKDQNEFIYNLLTKLQEKNIIPVILNTSFNIQGKPILNRYSDALWIRDNTGLDKVITDKYILK